MMRTKTTWKMVNMSILEMHVPSNSWTSASGGVPKVSNVVQTRYTHRWTMLIPVIIKRYNTKIKNKDLIDRGHSCWHVDLQRGPLSKQYFWNRETIKKKNAATFNWKKNMYPYIHVEVCIYRNAADRLHCRYADNC